MLTSLTLSAFLHSASAGEAMPEGNIRGMLCLKIGIAHEILMHVPCVYQYKVMHLTKTEQNPSCKRSMAWTSIFAIIKSKRISVMNLFGVHIHSSFIFTNFLSFVSIMRILLLLERRTSDAQIEQIEQNETSTWIVSIIIV